MYWYHHIVYLNVKIFIQRHYQFLCHLHCIRILTINSIYLYQFHYLNLMLWEKKKTWFRWWWSSWFLLHFNTQQHHGEGAKWPWEDAKLFMSILINRPFETFVWMHMSIGWHHTGVKIQGSNIKYANDKKKNYLNFCVTKNMPQLLPSIKHYKCINRHQEGWQLFCQFFSDIHLYWCNIRNLLKSFMTGSK